MTVAHGPERPLDDFQTAALRHGRMDIRRTNIEFLDQARGSIRYRASPLTTCSHKLRSLVADAENA